MYLLTVTLVLTHAAISCAYENKCCDSDEIFDWVDSSYRCVKDVKKRLQVLTTKTNFLDANSDGVCVDVSTDFFLFNISSGEVVDRKPVGGRYFPKCCPLNYTYNSALHSCEENRDFDHSFIDQSFIKVGLPHCKVIVDSELDGFADFDYGLVNDRANPSSFCIDENEKGLLVMRECRDNLDACKDVRCVKKCCPDGQSFINRSVCYDTYTHGLNLSSFSSVENPEGKCKN